MKNNTAAYISRFLEALSEVSGSATYHVIQVIKNFHLTEEVHSAFCWLARESAYWSILCATVFQGFVGGERLVSIFSEMY